MSLEYFDDTCEVRKTACETVNLVNHHYVDLASLDVTQQSLKSGPIRIAA